MSIGKEHKIRFSLADSDTAGTHRAEIGAVCHPHHSAFHVWKKRRKNEHRGC
jgi:hypothetical protein